MNRRLAIAPRTFGSGTGKSDIFPVAVVVDETKNEYDSFEFVDDTLLLSGVLGEYLQRVDLLTTPGYFYLGDRELYLFGEKITQLSVPVQSGEQYTIKLFRIPDGACNDAARYYMNEYDEYDSVNLSASPIFIRRHPSGELSSMGIPFDVPISSISGLSGELGYRTGMLNGSGVVLSGEPDSFPWYFSPLERFAKGYEFWRSGEVVPYDGYEYDLLTNTIILDEVEEGYEYVVEYEGANEPTLCGIDLSPLVVYPESWVLCLSPSGELFPDEVASVNLLIASSRISGGICTVEAEVLGETGNRLSGREVEFSVGRRNLTLGNGGNIVPLTLGTCTVLGGYDMVYAPSGIIRHDGTTIASDHRLHLSALIPSAGYFCTSGGFPENNPYGSGTTTDRYGIASAPYLVPPSLSRTSNVVFTATCEGVSCSREVILVSEARDVVYSIDDMYQSDWMCTTGSVWESGRVAIPLPSGAISPSSVYLSTLSGIIDDLYLARFEEDYTKARQLGDFSGSGIVDIAFSGDTMLLVYDVPNYSGEPLIVSYLTDVADTYLDGRNCYGLPDLY